MADTIDLPAAGKIKKKYVYIGLAAVAGIVGYAWWKQRGAGEPAYVEPGIEDYTGGVQTGTPGTTSPGLGLQDDIDTDPDDLPPTTNAQWTQRGTDYLITLGFDPQLVATTLGKYLARVPLTMAEADIVRTVEGAIGKPPVGEFRIIIVGGGTTPDPEPEPDPPDDDPPAPAPAGEWVTVCRWREDDPPWCSTLSGIAAEKLGSAGAWRRIWDHPRNAGVKRLRGSERRIRQGDRLWVPK